MKKRLYRVLIALTMILILFSISACGGTTDATSEETFPETEEADTKVADGEYKIYPSFVTTFEFEDNVLTLGTEDVFRDFQMPKEMAIDFVYPLAADFEWSDSTSVGGTDDVDWYEWFDFYWEGITMSTERYLDGQYGDYYTSGEDFCKKNAVWTIIIKDEEIQSISMDLAEEAAEIENKTSEESVVSNAKKDLATSTPASTASAHTHNYTGAVTKAATCSSQGTMTYVCGCGSSYTEAIPCTDHTWKERYGTIEHPSQGEMRQVQVGTSSEVYVCNACGGEFSSAEEQRNHIAALVGVDNDHVMRGGTTIRSGVPVYEEQWVVTQEAWTETIVVGYDCTTCGATK